MYQTSATRPVRLADHRRESREGSSRDVSRPGSGAGFSAASHSSRSPPAESLLLTQNRGFASPLHHHLYESGFLQGALSDVRLSAHGRIYNLHRLVLAQSDYFRSLLAGGFSEQALTDAHSSSPVIPLSFDENSSRAAFEYCIARLYGGGPELVFPATSRADPAAGHPLTETFTRQAQGETPLLEPVYDLQEVQLATPDFILSLLTTALYLELPQLVQHALHLIHESITPYTVTTFLRFALGEGVATPPTDDPCAGLSSVSTPMPASAPTSIAPASGYFYGEAAERIGEACICWLSRWAADILPVEEAQGESASPAIRIFSWTGLGGLSSDWLRVLLSSDLLFLERDDPAAELSGSSELQRYEMAKRAIELRRRQKSSWSSACDTPGEPSGANEQADDSLDDADSAAGEEVKQTAASHVRARQSTRSTMEDVVAEDDEVEYERLFAEGIYLSHLPFDTLQQMSRDLSPTTRQPFVPAAVIFRAHWDASRLRSLLPLTPSGSIFVEEADASRANLQLSIPFGSDLPILPSLAPSSSRKWVVPVDETIRINDNAASLATTVADHDAVSPESEAPVSTSSQGNAGKQVSRTNEGGWQPKERYLGLANPMIEDEGSHVDRVALEGRSYATFEPFRFSAEFWDIDQLREKQRLYSHTVVYAGSKWNLYIQVLRKSKGRIQLGIYLHRQSPHVPTPPASRPPHMASAVGRTDSWDAFEKDQEQDARSNVQAFFSISCPSLGGTSLTRFASNADSFSYNQSWGWKSSSLRGDEYFSSPGAAGEHSLASADPGISVVTRYVSLRCSVVMGCV